MSQLSHKSQAVSIRRDDGKVVGKVVGDVFHKNIKGSVHLLRCPPAIANDLQVLLDAQKAGAQWVEILDTETGKVYRASLHTILQSGKLFDRGFGKQVYLPMSRWATGGDIPAEQMEIVFSFN